MLKQDNTIYSVLFIYPYKHTMQQSTIAISNVVWQHVWYLSCIDLTYIWIHVVFRSGTSSWCTIHTPPMFHHKSSLLCNGYCLLLPNTYLQLSNDPPSCITPKITYSIHTYIITLVRDLHKHDQNDTLQIVIRDKQHLANHITGEVIEYPLYHITCLLLSSAHLTTVGT